MLLCFGTYASVLRLCAQETVKNKVLVSTLVRTIDKNEQYGASGNDTQVSRLINCKGDFPSVQVESGSGAVRTNGGSMTEIVALAREVTTGQLLEEFQNTVIPLLDEDKKDEAVLALLDIISKDKSITGAHQKAFEKYLGMSANRLVELAEINLTSFLAGLFLYSVVVGSNNSNAARETLTAIRGEFYLDSLKMKKDSLRVCEERNESIGKAKVEPAGAYQKYLDALKEKYNTVKTLLYTDTPRPFYDFYVCNDVYRTILAKTHPRRYRNEVISDADARKFLSVSRYIILRGTGGLGKSMMMRHLLLDSIERYPETGVVPIFVSLKDYNETYDDLSDYIYSCVRGLWKSLTKEHLRKLLASGKALLLLDGLDEIHSSCAGQYERALDDFVDAYPDNMYIISSRPFISFASYARFTILHLQPFNKSQALKLVDNLDFREDEPVIKQKFRRELDTKLFYTAEYDTYETDRALMRSWVNDDEEDEGDGEDEDWDYSSDEDEEDLLDGILCELRVINPSAETMRTLYTFAGEPGTAPTVSFIAREKCFLLYNHEGKRIERFDCVSEQSENILSELTEGQDTPPTEIHPHPEREGECFIMYPNVCFAADVRPGGSGDILMTYSISGVEKLIPDSDESGELEFKTAVVPAMNRFIVGNDTNTYEWDTANDTVIRKYSSVFYDCTAFFPNAAKDRCILVHRHNGVSLFGGSPIKLLRQYCFQEPGYVVDISCY